VDGLERLECRLQVDRVKGCVHHIGVDASFGEEKLTIEKKKRERLCLALAILSSALRIVPVR
jgi:hypothetical protein